MRNLKKNKNKLKKKNENFSKRLIEMGKLPELTLSLKPLQNKLLEQLY